MLTSIYRGIIIYLLLILCVRLMGKRQIGELQPSDLIVTILVSDIAASPIDDPDKPFWQSIVKILLLVSMEIGISFLSLRIPFLRRLVQGNSLLVIEDGKINQKAMKKMRMTVDDLTEALRQNNAFDISEVKYAYVETNGKISVEMSKKCKPVTSDDLDMEKSDESGIPFVIISDGRTIGENLSKCNMDRKKLDRELQKRKLLKKDVFIMTADKNGVIMTVKKEK